MTSRRLNFAGFLAKHFITSKLTLVFIIAVALMGVVAVLQTPREENPADHRARRRRYGRLAGRLCQ